MLPEKITEVIIDVTKDKIIVPGINQPNIEGFVYESKVLVGDKAISLLAIDLEHPLDIPENSHIRFRLTYSDENQVVELPMDKTKNLVDFFRLARRPGANCKDFVNDLCFGWGAEEKLNNIAIGSSDDCWSLDSNTSGEIGDVIVMSRSADLSGCCHVVMSLGGDLCISVEGGDGPITITTLEQLALIYDAENLFKINPCLSKDIISLHSSHSYMDKPFSVDKNGDTVLHKAALENDIERVEEIISEYGIDVAAAMAKTVNNKGLIPQTQPHLSAELEELLFPLTMQNTLKKLAEQIDFEEVRALYSAEEGTKLYHNLQIACDLVNLTRQTITASSTHPELTGTKVDSARKLYNDIAFLHHRMLNDRLALAEKMLEQNSDDYELELVPEVDYFVVKFRLGDKLRRDFLDNQVGIFKEFGLGDCCQFSYVALSFLVEKYKTEGIVYEIKNGGHVVLIVEPHGANPVICDAWSGTVFPQSFMNHLLNTHQGYFINGICYNIATSFNPNYHYLSPCFLSDNTYNVNAGADSEMVRKAEKIIAERALPRKLKESEPRSSLPEVSKLPQGFFSFNCLTLEQLDGHPLQGAPAL